MKHAACFSIGSRYCPNRVDGGRRSIYRAGRIKLDKDAVGGLQIAVTRDSVKDPPVIAPAGLMPVGMVSAPGGPIILKRHP